MAEKEAIIVADTADEKLEKWNKVALESSLSGMARVFEQYADELETTKFRSKSPVALVGAKVALEVAVTKARRMARTLRDLNTDSLSEDDE